MLLRLAPTYRTFSDTIDEPYHLGAGLCKLQTGHLLRGIEHPPLARLVAALPVYLSGVRDLRDASLHEVQDNLSAFVVGHDALVQSTLGYWPVLTRARLAMLVFPIAAVVYAFLLASRIGGRWAGVAAAAWLSTDPTLLGHATWIATDVPAAAAFLAILYHGLRWIELPSWRRTILAGVVSGLAISCKFTVMLAAPPLLLGVIAVRWFTPHELLSIGKTSVRLVLVIVIAVLVFWATYGFDFDATGPMPSLRRGLAEVSRHSREGHAAFLNGAINPHGFWLYFPEAFVLKSPLAVSAAIAAAIFFGFKTRRAEQPATQFAIALLAAAVGLFGIVAIIGPLNLGVRHLLPAIATLYPILAVCLRRVPKLLVALIAISFVETAIVHPNYLSYFNLIAGGPSGGGRYLLDSNLDWGQDLARTHDWLEANAQGRTVSLHLFGNPRLQEWPHPNYTLQPANEPPRDLILVSKNIAAGLYGDINFDAAGKVVDEPPLIPPRNAKPIATIGTSIDVYALKGR